MFLPGSYEAKILWQEAKHFKVEMNIEHLTSPWSVDSIGRVTDKEKSFIWYEAMEKKYICTCHCPTQTLRQSLE